MGIAVFTKGAIIETPNNIKVVVIDSYALDAKTSKLQQQQKILIFVS